MAITLRGNRILPVAVMELTGWVGKKWTFVTFANYEIWVPISRVLCEKWDSTTPSLWGFCFNHLHFFRPSASATHPRRVRVRYLHKSNRSRSKHEPRFLCRKIKYVGKQKYTTKIVILSAALTSRSEVNAKSKDP